MFYMAYEKLVCIDIDGTLSEKNSWERMNVALGMSPEKDYKLFKAYMANEIIYDDWLNALVTAYARGSETHERIIVDLFSDTNLVPEARDVVSAAQSAGYNVLLLSGAVDEFVHQVAKELGVTDYRACTQIVYDEEGYIERFAHAGDERDAKVHLLKEYVAEVGLSLDQCICVGDGGNDEGIFELTGKGIAFEGTPIAHKAWKVIPSLAALPSVL